MSLVTHWPLNGNTLDYSGNGFHLTNSNATISENGKIGSCYEFNGTNSCLFNYNFIKINKEFSFSIFFKISNEENDNTNLKGIFYLGKNTSAEEQPFNLNYFNGQIKFGSLSCQPNYNFSCNCEKGIWYNFIITYKNNKMKIFLNGTCIKEDTHELNFFNRIYDLNIGKISSNSNLGRYFKGFINDIKIFNHELSKKEIDELYKTKILDWKFNECEEPTINLIKNGNFINYLDPKFTFFNGIETTIEKDKFYYLKMTRKANFSGFIGLRYLEEKNYIQNTKITISLKFRLKKILNQNLRIYYPEYGTNGLISHHHYLSIKEQELNKWHFLTTTFEIKANSKTVGLYIDWHQTSSLEDDTVEITNIQVEEKAYSTEFTPNERPGKIIDSSGYRNHGLATLANTPKWDNKKFIFNGTNFITSTTKLLSSTEQCWTVIARIKLYGFNNTQYLNDFNLGCRISHYGGKPLNYLNSGPNDLYRYSNSSLEVNKEYEVAFVYNHKTRRIDFYLNGVLDNGNCVLNTVELTKNPAGIKDITKFFEGFNGECSRVRIFARDLTSEEIKNEYQNSLVLDKNKNVYCSELVLKPNSTMGLTKQGQLSLTDIQEVSNKQPVLFEQKELNGKLYGLIFYHNCVGGTVLFDNNKENFLNCNEENKKSLLSELEKFRINGKFEFLLEYDELKNQYNNWEQTSNPTETQEIEGYKELNCSWKTSSWNGIALSTEPHFTWVDGSPKTSTWYYAIGCRSKYANGMPTNNLSTSTWVKLWVRLNNSIEITKNNNLICNEIREV